MTLQKHQGLAALVVFVRFTAPKKLKDSSDHIIVGCACALQVAEKEPKSGLNFKITG
jgi:hypothetical protein